MKENKVNRSGPSPSAPRLCDQKEIYVATLAPVAFRVCSLKGRYQDLLFFCFVLFFFCFCCCGFCCFSFLLFFVQDAGCLVAKCVTYTMFQ